VGRFTFGVILGLAIGILDVLLMLPLAFPAKAPRSASCERATALQAVLPDRGPHG